MFFDAMHGSTGAGASNAEPHLPKVGASKREQIRVSLTEKNWELPTKVDIMYLTCPTLSDVG